MLSSLLKYRFRVKDPSGRIHCGSGWRRTRENSLNLRDAEFWLVWKGTGKMSTGERTLALYPGLCALMRPGGIYDAELEEADPLGITYVHFDVLEPRGKRVVTKAACGQWPEFFWLDDLAFSDAISRRIVQRFQQWPETAESLLRGLLMDVLQSPLASDGAPAAALPAVQRRRISRWVDKMRSGGTFSTLTVAEMAEQVHLSSSHFSRLFRQTTGQSPIQFLLQIRIGHARHLLRETDLSVGEIANELGYRDLFFFSRQFMQKEGVSPTEYRGSR
ncbi:MAG: helix-turn-helix domain-containing protein [Chthoniobacteraceae bacterium]